MAHPGFKSMLQNAHTYLITHTTQLSEDIFEFEQENIHSFQLLMSMKIYLSFAKFVKSRGQVIDDAINCSRKSNSAKKQNNQNHIGE